MATVTATLKKEKYTTTITTENHTFLVDEPTQVGGADQAASPLEYLASALASCTAITIKMYAERKEWNLQEVSVKVDFTRNIQENTASAKKEITLNGNLSEEQKERLLTIGKQCPIHKILTNPVEIESFLV
ncbi:MAG: OsmC family protein [Capnocytophaga sp.]|nr:OsmC family protein [Capnocytophaga sp.]